MKSTALSLATVTTIFFAGFAATAHAADDMPCCDSEMKAKCGAMMKGMHGHKTPQSSSGANSAQPSVDGPYTWGG